MKRITWLIICLLIPIMISAQTQQGIVKTRGRMVNRQLMPGIGLPGATVTVKGGNAVVSGNTGTFTLVIPGNNFYLQNVQKKGYQLVDADVLTKPYKHSTNPLYLVMETPEQQQSDLLAAERKIRKNLRNQLEAKEAEIEALQASQQEKDSLLHVLYQQQGDNEKLISDMAKRYSTLDYDQLDEFYRQVSWFIENGELTRADSLLRTRGDINVQVRNIIKQGQTIQKEEEHIQKAKAVQQADIEEAARRCYSYYETFLAQHQNDSAAYYLELRAEMDTTNLKWQSETGEYVHDYLADYSKALNYFQLVLRQSLVQEGEEGNQIASAYNNIGRVYSSQGDYSKALEYDLKALDIFEKVLGTEHPDVATSYNNIGAVYVHQGDYPKALEYFSKALAIFEKMLGTEHPDVAASYNNIGAVYDNQGDYPKALEYHSKALAIREKVLGTEHPDVATSYDNIGAVYDNQGDYLKALEYYSKALDIREKVLGTEHPDVAASYNNIGAVYVHQGDYPKALEYYSKALAIWEKVLGTEHPDVATSYDNIGVAYDSQGDYPKALEHLSKALAIREKVLGTEHPNVATSYNNIGAVYDSQGDYPKALEYHSKALDIREKVFGTEHPNVALSYNNIGFVYGSQGDYPKALEYHSKALAIREKVLGTEHPGTKKTKSNIMYIKYKMALSEGNITHFIDEHCFTATIDEDETPAKQQGMSGEYVLLEFADWTQNSKTSLFDKNEEMRGKPKDILVMKDGIITLYHFENTIGALFGIKQIGKEEKQLINKAYEEWKKQNRK